MWRIKRALSILFTVALALQAIAGSAAAAILYVDDDGSGNYTTIQDAVDDAASGDTIIVNPGTYTEEITISVPDLVLASSSQYNAVIRSTENAFNLKANNITIKSFNIIGTGSAGYYGIADSSPSCTIQNNKISNFYIGIGVSNVDGGGGGSIINNDIFDCGDGVLLFSSSVNEISGNRISNCETGIDIIDSYGTRFYNNNFNNTRNVQSAADSHWNTTKKSGKNIIGGPYIGGNYWATPAGDGFSQTHLDANGDGFAEVPYEMNEVNIDSLPLVTPRTEPAPVLPAANFKVNITQGPAPLVVQFTDISQNAASRNWDFDNDGKVDSTAESEVHIYTDPKTYTVNLTAINMNGTTSKTAVITVLEKGNDVLPTADFSTNVSSGIAPLSVLFTDLSQNATSRSWDVNNDGVEDSNESSFTHIYTSAGTYTTKLTAINANGTYTKTMTIAVEEKSSGGSSSGGSSSGGSSSGGSSGGGGGSPEPAKNVEVKELSQVFITNGKAVKFDFTKNATCVVYIGFDAIKNVGKTTTIVEQLKNKSALVSELPSGEVYKSFNVWVGNSGYVTSKNIKNPVLCFKVEKAWIKDKKIDKSSITLNRYEEKVWVQLPASLSGEDEKYLYFTARVPGYASFAITGKSTLQVQDENSQIPAENRSVGAFSSEDNGTEGAEPDESSKNGSTLLSVGIVIGALVVAGVVLKSMKK
ncbi:PGF-pre-PGF domain-containing protein [Methanosarcina sp.]|uniref:PGF-pre-PGF domain-containing protein n=1 Tax=Methanosarcina sp. TaxID=2213 RepID=UPI002ABCDAE3|nr:PGF-pre-PGF domain-containing protein [Methanosarcina sp.]MDY9925198.1 PGF-pre-PGF domain-containing protein [Methanosarcina sp.]